MITIFVFAILMAIAVPSFRDASLGARLSSIANNMVASVQLARSEAIKRNTVITLCASSDGSTCDDAADWDKGWVVRDDVAGTVIQAQQALPAGWKLTQAGGTDPVAFQPIGVGATAATFKACRSQPVGKQERVVTVTATGMAYVTSTTAGSCP